MIRWGDPATAASTIAQIQYRAVREGPSLYTEAQRAAWMPSLPDAKAMAKRLSSSRIALFERQGEAVGVMTLGDDGCIDLSFILPEHQGTGVFRALAEAIETAARDVPMPRLWTNASLMAQAPFQSVGFSVSYHEEVERAGQRLPRARMDKGLT